MRGRAEAVEDPDELRTSSACCRARGPSGSRSLYLRIPLTEVTGRRLGDGWDLEETLPVRRVLVTRCRAPRGGRRWTPSATLGR